MFAETNSAAAPSKKGYSDPNISSSSDGGAGDDFAPRNSSFSAYDPNRLSGEGSPMMMSPWNQNSPFAKSPWSNFSQTTRRKITYLRAAWWGPSSEKKATFIPSPRKMTFSTPDRTAIIISGDKIFTGHQDGKIRVWKISPKNPSVHKRVGTMPTFFDIFKASIRPMNYVEVKRKRTALWIKHTDAISCLSMNEEKGLLYSASWDRTFKVWRVGNSKCVESVKAHDDAVNCVVSSVDGVVYTGSADGTVKVWKREENGKGVKHVLTQTLLSQECAVTALAVNDAGSVVYCGSSDGLVNFWEREKQLSHGGVLKGHKLAVLCLAAAGNLVFSGSADKTICVWRRDGAVHTCLSVLSGHTGPVKCLAVEEDKESAAGGDKKWVVYSGSLDKSVKVWSVSEMAPDIQQMALMQQRDGDFNWDSIPSAKY
ncbi:hypothetical protein DH2020_035345 [Rehmannia glutinosa]|uniref:Uncharacterized protein n=1 Tax=Rehmannia glutinosa TaxID=99300 RepID=A0ABR0V9L8_REHGL